MVFEPDPKVKKTCALQNVTYIATTFISVVYIYIEVPIRYPSAKTTYNGYYTYIDKT